jgi:tripartite-type tricarboxylate transporter receptor subunit TctC
VREKLERALDSRSPIIEKLRAALIRAMEGPEVPQRLHDEGATPESSTSDELGAFIRSEIVKWEKAVKISGAKIDSLLGCIPRSLLRC